MRVIHSYLSSSIKPFLFCFVSLVFLPISLPIGAYMPYWLEKIFLSTAGYIFTFALIGNIASIVFSLCKKWWRALIFQALGLAVILLLTPKVLLFVMVSSNFLPDRFAENLIIPSNITVLEPGREGYEYEAWREKKRVTADENRIKYI